MAFLVFAQSLGPAIALTLYNVIFAASLKSQLAEKVPNMKPQAIIQAGATGFRAIVAENDLPAVLVAYSNSIDRAFYLIAGMAAACGIFVWGMGWHDVRKTSEVSKIDEATDEGKSV
jgi:hypothetical protein